MNKTIAYRSIVWGGDKGKFGAVRAYRAKDCD